MHKEQFVFIDDTNSVTQYLLWSFEFSEAQFRISGPSRFYANDFKNCADSCNIKLCADGILSQANRHLMFLDKQLWSYRLYLNFDLLCLYLIDIDISNLNFSLLKCKNSAFWGQCQLRDAAHKFTCGKCEHYCNQWVVALSWYCITMDNKQQTKLLLLIFVNDSRQILIINYYY